MDWGANNAAIPPSNAILQDNAYVCASIKIVTLALHRLFLAVSGAYQYAVHQEQYMFDHEHVPSLVVTWFCLHGNNERIFG